MHKLLAERKQKGTLRSLNTISCPIDLTSNDYFGFAKSWTDKSTPIQMGSTGSRLLTGNHISMEKLEYRLAQYHHAEAALLFNSGYVANVGLLSALGQLNCTILFDKQVHASIIDGIRLSDAKAFSFRHNDTISLENRLKQVSSPIFVVVESLYSISGDFAPLRAIIELCQKYGAYLIVDEAHATGLYGKKGEGLVVHQGLEEHVFARIHTFSKALGVHGACVVGSSVLKNTLINFSRPFIYTTALPLPMIRWIDQAYDKLENEANAHQQKLETLKASFRTNSPVHPIYCPSIQETTSYAKKLQEIGIDVRAVLPPTTPQGKQCLRVVLHSFNTTEQLQRLKEALPCGLLSPG